MENKELLKNYQILQAKFRVSIIAYIFLTILYVVGLTLVLTATYHVSDYHKEGTIMLTGYVTLSRINWVLSQKIEPHLPEETNSYIEIFADGSGSLCLVDTNGKRTSFFTFTSEDELDSLLDGFQKDNLKFSIKNGKPGIEKRRNLKPQIRKKQTIQKLSLDFAKKVEKATIPDALTE